MIDNNYKSSEQLADLINKNNNNKSSNSRFDYYKKILNSSSTDTAFQNMLNTISFKELTPLPKNNTMFSFPVKCFNNMNNVILGPVNENYSSLQNISDLTSLTIPMSHYHLSKSNFVQDNFVYKITNNETGPIAKFIERVRLIDNRINMLISNYIKQLDMSSPLTPLLFKNKNNWAYTGMINKIKDVEYLNIRYFKNSLYNKRKIGTNVYCGNNYIDEMAELLSRNTFCSIYGKIYPFIKVNYILINERVINGIPTLNFTCKAYFVDMIFEENSIHCSTQRAM